MDFQDNENNMQELMSIFQTESEEILERIFDELLELEKKPEDRELTAALYRDIHSIKGAVRMVGFNNIQTILHKIEDILDIVNENNIVLDKEKITIITRSIELVGKYLQESVKNQREIIGDELSSTISTLEYLRDIDLATTSIEPPDILADLANIAENIPNDLINSINAQVENNIIETKATPVQAQKIQEQATYDQESINFSFNSCFEIIDSIVPEEESQEVVILREEIAKIYEH